MKKNNSWPLLLLLYFFVGVGCHSGGNNHSPVKAAAVPTLIVTGPNTLPIQAGGSSAVYENEPLVSVTVCSPGTNHCQTISNILLDTGSTGLRIFSSVLSVKLTQSIDKLGNAIGECETFGTGTTWGPVQTASVILGGEPAINIPIQVIDSTFAQLPSPCTSADTDPSVGYNGILGVGVFATDCPGGFCSLDSSNDIYYSCQNAKCTSTTVSSKQQVSNPVFSLPTDNNGVIVELPPIPAEGAPQAIGTLVLGIGTQDNNKFSNVSTYQTNAQGWFTVQFNGTAFSHNSFIDSGSNGIFFPPSADPSLPQCASGNGSSPFYCPNSGPVSLTAVNVGENGSAQGPVDFQVRNAESTFNSSNYLFNNLAGTSASGFDWGLPFFFGRLVFVGIQGRTSPAGLGPYWAY
jgi:hypothetical protein